MGLSSGIVFSICLTLLRTAVSFTDEDRPFSAQPQEEPYYVVEGDQGPTLACSFEERYRNRSQYEFFWTRVHDGVPELLTRYGENFFPHAYDLFDDASCGNYSLKLKTADFDEDNAQFFCVTLDREREQKVGRPAKVVVVVSPTAPVIHIQPLQAVRENDLVSFECQTFGGHPAPEFSWKFENSTPVPDSWYITRPPVHTRGNASSLLQWRVDASENGAYVICEIWNRALASGEKLTKSSDRLNVKNCSIFVSFHYLMLKVLYPPRVHAGPSSLYNVEEGKRLELLCKATGNPEPKHYEWIQVATGETHSSATWSFVAEKKSNGDFRCMAENLLGKATSKMTVEVLYGPIVSVQEFVSFSEGDNLDVECKIDARPEPKSVIWTSPNGFSQEGRILRLPVVKRSDAGNYTCTAVNKLHLHSSNDTVTRSGQASSFIDIRYAPGKAVISSPNKFFRSGDRVVLDCALDLEGNPKAEFKWIPPVGLLLKDTSDLRQSKLVVENSTLDHNGVYRCIPYNTEGYGREANFSVLITQSATVTQFNPGSNSRKVGEDVQMTCEAVGYPAPKILWKNDGVDLVRDFNFHWKTYPRKTNSQCEKCAVSVTETLTFRAFWNDKGNYTCVAINEVDGTIDTKSAVVSVVHPPKLVVPFSDGRPTFSTKPGDEGRIICQVSAYPKPEIKWSKKFGTESLIEPKFLVRTAPSIKVTDEYMSVLVIRNVDETDYGEYVCEASNKHGTSEFSINLEGEKLPEVPRRLGVLKVGTSWIQVGWLPSVRDSEEHHYELEYRSGRNFGGLTAPWTSISIYPSNVSRVAQLNIEDGHSIYVYRSHNFTFLPPLSLLRFRLRVVTSSGFSEWTPLRSKSTLDVDVDEELPAPSIVEFNHNGGNVTIETAGKVSCYMIYTGRSDSVSSPFVWSGVGCFEQSSFYLFPTIHGGHFSIRSCIRREPFLCSNATDYHVNNDSGSSHAGVLIAVTVLVALVMVAALGALLFTCCRRDFFLKPYKADLDDGIRREEIPKLSMPKVETKNTVEHGSQADSGVFTLRSAQEFPNNCPLGGNSSPATWSPYPGSENGYELNDLHLMNSFPYDYIERLNQENHSKMSSEYWNPVHSDRHFLPLVTLEHPVVSQISMDESTDSVSASYVAEGSLRRVIKEIIV